MDDLTAFTPAELTGPWPAHAPTGTLTLSRHDDELHIDHADPRVVFSAELIESLAGSQDRVTVTGLNYTIPHGHIGALLKVKADNRQVVYRLTGWLPTIRAYVGEWPE